MRIIYTILLAIMIMTFSCVEDYKSGKKDDLTTSHQYPFENDPYGEEPLVKPNDTSVRSQWQKPDKVLKRIGHLNKKVVADIGAGTGYFSILFMTSPTEKVIAIDINQSVLDTLQSTVSASRLDEATRNKLEPRLVPTDNPKLKDEEVDIVFMSNTYIYIEDKVEYLKIVKKGMKPKGRICIVDYKMKKLPAYCPPVEERMPLYVVENQLEEAGFKHLYTDDQLLDFQYLVIAEKE